MTAQTSTAEPHARSLFDDLFSPEGRQDPYTRYALLRETAPVLRYGEGNVVLTRYEDCDRVLRDHAAFPVHLDSDVARRVQNEGHPSLLVLGESMLERNPPDHTRLRRLVSAGFTARRVQGLTERVGELVGARLDAMAEAGADGAAVDAYEYLALPLPIAVIGTLLGIPEADWSWLRGHAADLAHVIDLITTEEQLARADAAQLAITPYLDGLVAERRSEPRDDLISALVAVQDETSGPDAALTDDEMAGMLSLLFLAGYETTVNLITNGVVELLRHPEQAEPLRADPSLAGAYVEEILRYDAPVQGTGRPAAADTVIGGEEIPAGTYLSTMLGAANRDPARFQDPDRFDPTRTGGGVLSFGAGIHFCLGAPLARLEAGLALPALLRRFPKLELAAEPTRRESFNLRGYDAVPVCII